MDKNYKIVVRHEGGNKDFDEVSIQELSNKIISKLSLDLVFKDLGQLTPTLTNISNKHSVLQLKKPEPNYSLDGHKIPSDFYGTVVIINLTSFDVDKYHASNVLEKFDDDYLVISTGINYHEETNKLYLYFNQTFEFDGKLNIN